MWEVSVQFPPGHVFDSGQKQDLVEALAEAGASTCIWHDATELLVGKGSAINADAVHGILTNVAREYAPNVQVTLAQCR